MQLSTDLLRTFTAVTETASFTRAAELVNRTQSAVSQQIRKLEEELGQRLFSREGREVKPTAMGENLLSYARRMLRLHDEAVQALSEPEITGLVRFGAPDDYATGFLPEVLHRFAETHPRVQVEVRCLPSRDLRHDLERGELDLAVYSCGDLPENAQLLGQEPLRWATSSKHPAHEQDPLPLAVYYPDCLYRKWSTAALDNAGIAFRIAYVSQSLAGIQAAVTAGLAVAPLGICSLPRGARILGEAEGFPELPSANLALLRGPKHSEPVERLAATVAESFRASLGEPKPKA